MRSPGQADEWQEEMKKYLMENKDEAYRLDIKTSPEKVREQALRAGIQPGMRIADIGCGAGKTSSVLREMVGPDGSVVGVDASEQRLKHARKNYAISGLTFEQADIRESLDHLGRFDFIWVRFVLEYFKREAPDIIRNITNLLEPDGVLCLIDLDYNCLNHYGLSDRLSRTLHDVVAHLEDKKNFDPYAGRKLYALLYDNGFRDIGVHFDAHHLIYGELDGIDEYNWIQKLEVAAKNCGCRFEEYDGSYESFVAEFEEFFRDPRRFSYTPLIQCYGIRPRGEIER